MRPRQRSNRRTLARRTLATLGLATALAYPELALAAKAPPTWPASVAGEWQVNAANFSLAVVIELEQAKEKADCPKITGNMLVPGQPTDQPLRGFYCPQSGRIVFSREFDGETIQVWAAQLTQPTGDKPPLMAGSFGSVRPNGGSFGERAFLAVAITD